MKIRRFKGKDMRDALNQVKDELGSDAVIMSNKKTATGIELVAAYDKESVAQPAPKRNLQQEAQANMAKAHIKPSMTLSEIIGDDGQDSLQALLEKQMKKEAQATATPSAPTQHIIPSLAESSFNTQMPEQPAPSVAHQASSLHTPAAAPSNHEMEGIRNEIESLKHIITQQFSEFNDVQQRKSTPVKFHLNQELMKMGIAPELTQQILGFVPDSADQKQAWTFVLKLLANRLSIANDKILDTGGVVALVGPTGTGKTTTIAKLAAKFAQRYGAESVAVVTIDTYRIAAYEQLATYAKIIGCSVKQAANSEELSQALYQLRNKKLVLIDSAGFSQRDTRLIDQLSSLENVTSLPIQKYLVLQASAQYQVLQRTVEAYRGIELSGCVLTKLDEAYSLGEALSVAIEYDLALTYTTHGQKVPEDLATAASQQLVADTAKRYKESMDMINNNNSNNNKVGMHKRYAANTL